MRELRIQPVENGFVVYELPEMAGLIGKSWAFESADTLADFIHIQASGHKLDIKNKE